MLCAAALIGFIRVFLHNLLFRLLPFDNLLTVGTYQTFLKNSKFKIQHLLVPLQGNNF